MKTKTTLHEKAQKIALLILDVDGVLTDGRLYFNDRGEFCKTFHVQDGFGMVALQKHGIPIVLLSGRDSPVVQRRAEELHITHIYQGVSNKWPFLKDLLHRLQLKATQVAYVGDDVPDLECLQHVGFSIAVPNAVDTVKAIADWITTRRGGEGAVREVCDFLMECR